MKKANKIQKITPIEAAHRLNLRLGYVYLLLREEKLRGDRVDGRWQIDPTTVEQFAQARKERYASKDGLDAR